MRKKLTASVLAKLKVPEGKASIKLFDSEVSGFGVRLMSSGISSFIFEKRPKGSLRGTSAQALLDRGWGKAKVEVVTDEKQDYVAALKAVNERLKQA